MKGVDGDGHEVTLTPLQERTVRQLLTWHRHGISAALPTMGKGSGKSVIMHTLAWYILENIEVSAPEEPFKRTGPVSIEFPVEPVVTLRRRAGRENFTDEETRHTPEGTVKVTSRYQAVRDGDNGVIGWHCTQRDCTLDGEPVYYPESMALAARAGIPVPNKLEWVNVRDTAT